MLKCPKCQSPEIEYYDCYDVIYDSDIITQYWSGYCRECKTPLDWEEDFKFDKARNIRRIEE